MKFNFHLILVACLVCVAVNADSNVKATELTTEELTTAVTTKDVQSTAVSQTSETDAASITTDATAATDTNNANSASMSVATNGKTKATDATALTDVTRHTTGGEGTNTSIAATTGVISTATTTLVSTTSPLSVPRYPTRKPNYDGRLLPVNMDLKLNGSWTKELGDNSSMEFNELKRNVEMFLKKETHEPGFNMSGSLTSLNVVQFRNGSILVDVEMRYNMGIIGGDKFNQLKSDIKKTLLVVSKAGIIPGTNSTIDEVYTNTMTLPLIDKLTPCMANICESIEKCNHVGNSTGCNHKCEKYPLGEFKDACNDGQCSISTDVGGQAKPICKCNDGFYFENDHCISHALLGGIIGGSLGFAVLILAIALIVVCCVTKKKVNKGSPLVQSTMDKESIKMTKDISANGVSKQMSEEMREDPRSQPNPAYRRYEDEQYLNEKRRSDPKNGMRDDVRFRDQKDDGYRNDRRAYRDDGIKEHPRRDVYKDGPRGRDYRDDPRDNRYPEEGQSPRSQLKEGPVWPVFSQQRDESNLERRIVSDHDRIPPKRTESWLTHGDRPVRSLSPEEEARFEMAKEADERMTRRDEPRRPADNRYKEDRRNDRYDRGPYNDTKYDNRDSNERDQRSNNVDYSRAYDKKAYDHSSKEGGMETTYNMSDSLKRQLSKEHKDFYPRLDVVDTSKDYSIKRPALTLDRN